MVEEANVVVGHEWADDAKVVITGKQFRQIINLMNQYPQMLAQVFQSFFDQSTELFGTVSDELESVVKQMEESGEAKPIYRDEFEKRMKDAIEKQQTSNPVTTTDVN